MAAVVLYVFGEKKRTKMKKITRLFECPSRGQRGEDGVSPLPPSLLDTVPIYLCINGDMTHIVLS